MNKLAYVVVDIKAININNIYIYYIPHNMNIKKGSYVRVPFGKNNKIIDAYVIDVKTNENNKKDLYKYIYDIIEVSFITEELIDLAIYFSQKTVSCCINFLKIINPLKIKRRIKDNFIQEIVFDDSKKYNKKTKELINFLKKEKLPLPVKEINNIFGQQFIRRKIKEGFLITTYMPSFFSFLKQKKENYYIQELNKEQKTALKELKKGLNKTFLLYGKTGSGKTEVYLRYIEYILSMKKNVIVLVPEISLSIQTINIFIQRFGINNIALIHSKISDKDKNFCLNRIKENKCKILLGTRSAIFYPLNNLGAIIIDEEHDNSYKQSTSPSYNTREIANWRAKYNKCNLILSSSTPSLESYFRYKKGLYKLLKLTKRINSKTKVVKIINMRKEIKNLENNFFSSELYNSIKECLKRKKQVILLINRRGHSYLIQCPKCGWIPKCVNCDCSLIFHKIGHTFNCHLCGFKRQHVSKCDYCKEDLFFSGVAIQKVYDYIIREFKARVLRADRDNINKLEDYLNMYEDFYNHKYDILIGTQMISKGFDFANVELVGVIGIDNLLFMPDFRSREKVYQLLTQVIGRSGRQEGIYNKNIIQTYEPDNSIFDDIKEDQYFKFADNELNYRKNFDNPPFCNLANIIIYSKNLQDTILFSNNIYKNINKISKSIKVYEPTFASVKRHNNNYYFNILIKYYNNNHFLDCINKIYKNFDRIKGKVNYYILINPEIII